MTNNRKYIRKKTKPLEHQFEAIKFLTSTKNVAYFDEQGMGKSKVIIDASINLLLKNTIQAVLIICPKTLIYTWRNEIKKHSYLIPAAIEGTLKNKAAALLSSPNIYVINYESVITNTDIIRLLLNTKKFFLVLDESQRIKNPETKIFKTINEIKNLAARRVILTGTPVANYPSDIWSQFYFLDGGETLGKSFSSFKREYKPDTLTMDKLNELSEKIRLKSLRRLKANSLQLPNKIYETIYVDMNEHQKNIYEKARNDLYIEIKNTNNQVVIDNIDNILKKLLRLVQLASNPLVVVPEYNELSGKVLVLDKLLKKILSEGSKAIIWTSFVDNVKFLVKRYSKYGALEIYGATPLKTRDRNIELFQSKKFHKILVANPAAAREGITLTAANYAIYFDRSFNLVDYLQSQDRIHRISQDKECYIIKLITKNSVDLFVEDRLREKTDIASVAQGDSSEYNKANYLSRDEILNILA